MHQLAPDKTSARHQELQEQVHQLYDHQFELSVYDCIPFNTLLDVILQKATRHLQDWINTT